MMDPADYWWRRGCLAIMALIATIEVWAVVKFIGWWRSR